MKNNKVNKNRQTVTTVPLFDPDELSDTDGQNKREQMPYEDANRPTNSAGYAILNDFRFARLDSVFYIICALAGLGMVISMYALITQNNAYIDKEFESLQRETAALNARLASVNAAASPAVAELARERAPVAEQFVDVDLPEDKEGAEERLITEVIETVSAPVDAIVLGQLSPTRMQPEIELLELRAELEEMRLELNAQRLQIQMLTDRNRSLREGRPAVNDNTLNSPEILNLSDTEQSGAVMHQSSDGGKADPTVVKTEMLDHSESAVGSDYSQTSDAAWQVAVMESEFENVSIVGEVATAAVNEPVLGSSLSDIEALLQEAYQVYQADRFEQARGIYNSALEFDPYHRDANLGAAASAYQLSDYLVAAQHYRHLLSLDPLDLSAFAGLLNIASINPDQHIIELELQQHTEHQGNAARLTAMLGNHFARQKRWRDAEAAYAVTLNSGANNADLLFNYAVVLDRLGQASRAVEYYQSALDASSESEFTFDTEGARLRLDSLTSG